MSCHYAAVECEALLHITGPDALTFLQGQITCDTRELAPDKALPGIYCTAQGRVICDFVLCQTAADQLALRMRRDVRSISAAAFNKYVIFSKAAVEAERDDWQVIACWGNDAATSLEAIFGAVPTRKFGACHGDGYLVVQVDEAGRQFECYLDQSAATGLPNQVQEAMQLAAASSWQALQIRSGTGRIEAATSGEFIPQMLNYDLTGHISFKKGCYTGQEVVARMHYRGKPKRRMYLATAALTELQGTVEPTAGTALFITDSDRSVGNVINCVAPDDSQLVALVTATADGIAAGLRIGSPDGPLLQSEELPYTLTGS